MVKWALQPNISGLSSPNKMKSLSFFVPPQKLTPWGFPAQKKTLKYSNGFPAQTLGAIQPKHKISRPTQKVLGLSSPKYWALQPKVLGLSSPTLKVIHPNMSSFQARVKRLSSPKSKLFSRTTFPFLFSPNLSKSSCLSSSSHFLLFPSLHFSKAFAFLKHFLHLQSQLLGLFESMR